MSFCFGFWVAAFEKDREETERSDLLGNAKARKLVYSYLVKLYSYPYFKPGTVDRLKVSRRSVWKATAYSVVQKTTLLHSDNVKQYLHHNFSSYSTKPFSFCTVMVQVWCVAKDTLEYTHIIVRGIDRI